MSKQQAILEARIVTAEAERDFAVHQFSQVSARLDAESSSAAALRPVLAAQQWTHGVHVDLQKLVTIVPLLVIHAPPEILI